MDSAQVIRTGQNLHQAVSSRFVVRGWQWLICLGVLLFTILDVSPVLAQDANRVALGLQFNQQRTILMVEHRQTVTDTMTPTATETATETPTQTPTFTVTPTDTLTTTVTTTATATPTASSQPISPLPTPSFTPAPSFTPIPTFTPLPTATGTATFTPLPTMTFTPAPTPTPLGTHVVAPAIVEFAAEPGAIIAGQSANLRWNLARTNAAVIIRVDGQEGIDPVTGVMAVTPITTTRYTLTASGAGGQVSRTITITVQMAPTAAPLDSAEPLSDTEPITEPIVVIEPETATNTPEPAPQVSPTETTTAAPIALNLTPDATITPENDDALAFDRSRRMRTVLIYALFALGVLTPIALILAAILFRTVWRRT